MIYDNIGCGDHTPAKQNSFRDICGQHVAVVRSILKKHRHKGWMSKEYCYIDMNSGAGQYNLPGDNQPIIGSPVIFQDVADGLKVDFRAHLFEVNADCCNSLAALTDPSRTTIYQMDHDLIDGEFQGYRKSPYGMLYHDPNDRPSFDAIARFSHLRICRFMDVLIHLSATNIKRVRCAHGGNDLARQLGQIKKEKWIITLGLHNVSYIDTRTDIRQKCRGGCAGAWIAEASQITYIM